MNSARLLTRRWVLLAPLVALLVLAGACGDDAGPTPTPLDLSSLTSDIQESIGAAVAGIDFPEAVSEAQIRDLVESAVSGVDIPEGLSQEDVRSIVDRAVTAAASEAVTEEDVVRAIAAEVARAAAAAPEGLSEADIDRIVKGAIPTPLPTPTPAPTATPVPTAAPETIEETVLSRKMNIAYASLPQNLDLQYTGQVYDTGVGFNLYDTLFEMEIDQLPNGTAQAPGHKVGKGGLAKDWEITFNPDESVTYTVQLRDDVVSSLGNPMTSKDVKYSFDRWFGLAAFGHFMIAIGGGFAQAEDINVVSDYVIELKTPAFHTNNLPVLTSHHTGIYDSVEVKKHATADDPWAREWIEKNAAGFSSYSISSWVPGQEFVYEVNPNYWGDTPFFDTVTIREAPSSSSRLAALLTGAVDATFDLSADEDQIVENTAGVSVTRFDGLTVEFINMVTTTPPFDDLRVRQAIAYAIPYDDIMQVSYKDKLAVRMRSVVPRVHLDYNATMNYETDLDKARELLAEAGYPDGFDMTITISTGFSAQEAMLIAIGSGLREVGINVTTAVDPPSVFFDKQFGGTYQAFITQQYALIPDSAYAMEVFWTSRACCNWSYFFSQELDDLSEAYVGTVNVTDRINLGRRMQEIANSSLGWIALANPTMNYYHNDSITGWTWYPGNPIIFRHLSRTG
jgi:peptide/nickel transport system substrate-binding protein